MPHSPSKTPTKTQVCDTLLPSIFERRPVVQVCDYFWMFSSGNSFGKHYWVVYMKKLTRISSCVFGEDRSWSELYFCFWQTLVLPKKRLVWGFMLGRLTLPVQSPRYLLSCLTLSFIRWKYQSSCVTQQLPLPSWAPRMACTWLKDHLSHYVSSSFTTEKLHSWTKDPGKGEMMATKGDRSQYPMKNLSISHPVFRLLRQFNVSSNPTSPARLHNLIWTHLPSTGTFKLC